MYCVKFAHEHVVSFLVSTTSKTMQFPISKRSPDLKTKTDLCILYFE